MSDFQPTHSRNLEATDQLRQLVASLELADYQRELGGGWTIGLALAHIAFWDARQIAALERLSRDGAFPTEDPAVNDALEALGPAVQSETIGVAAVRAAEQLDAALDALGADLRDQLQRNGFAYVLDRSPHREEHMAQIEAAL